jgi:hypothetical protein
MGESVSVQHVWVEIQDQYPLYGMIFAQANTVLDLLLLNSVAFNSLRVTAEMPGLFRYEYSTEKQGV